MTEPTVIINGTTLTNAQSMTMRVAITTYLTDMANEHALGEDAAGEAIRSAYHARSSEIVRLMLSAPAPAPQMEGTVPCPCTTFEQDEDCPVGYPSLLCTACDGTGNAPIDKVAALAAEMLKVAAQVGEPDDPFAAWETIDLVESQRDRLRNALEPFAEAAGRFDGVPVSESLSQQCWFTPDSLREARAALTATTEGQP